MGNFLQVDGLISDSGITATTVVATTLYGDGSNITGISAEFTGGTVTGPSNFTNGLTATTIQGNGANITGMTGNFGLNVDGSNSVITSGIKGFLVMPYNATIVGWDIIGNTTGSCMVDVWKTTGPSIPTIANTITGTEKPRLNSQQINSDNTLSTWSTSVFTNDVVAFNVVSATTVSRINLIIKVIKN